MKAKTMEEAAHDNRKSSWTSITNWTIADGSLVNSIAFESSMSSNIDNDDEDDDQNTDINSTPKFPLILYPPTADPAPCEITITFAQKHEVQQVYVRSTARVYEIYYAPDLRSSNEYLCTVRCGIATRDEEILHVSDVDEAVLTHQKGSSEELDEKKTKSDSSSNTNEDGWVEVKSIDSAQLGNGNSPSPSYSTKPEGSTQDLYEATAEISDAEPCMSVTLRLLSLQNKGCVFVDEIYVFGDPVEPADSENGATQMENHVGSSLMAMFVPSLLQLSKARNAGQVQDDHAYDTREKQKLQEIGSKETDLTNVANKVQWEENSGLTDKKKVKLQETVGAAAIPRPELPPLVSDTESKPDFSSRHIEKALDHLVSRVSSIEDILVSRVSSIEDILLRFEERMLKPINSIEARLQYVEQQVEELNKKSQNSARCTSTRISAPEFSCHELDDVFDDNENNIPESHEKHCPLCVPPEDMADLENADQRLASLSVTAPEFLSTDDEEENDGPEAVTGSTKEKPKQALSVDDALASALAGFLSSTSAEPQKYTQALAIKAPDFSFEEESNSGKKASSEVKDGIVTGPPICFIATDETEFINDSVSSSSDIFCLESEVEIMKSVDNHYSEKNGEGVDDLCWHNKEGKDDAQDRTIYCEGTPAGQEVAKANLYQTTEDISSVEVSNGVSNNCVLDEFEAVNEFLENQTNDNTEEGVVVNSEFSSATEVEKEEPDKVILQNFLEFSCVSSVVDFEVPILDVKFVSQEISNTKSLLEALLTDIPEALDEAPSGTENDDGSQIGQQDNLISVDDWEPTTPANGSHFSIDVDYCTFGEMPLNVEDEKLLDSYMSNNSGEPVASLI